MRSRERNIFEVSGDVFFTSTVVVGHLRLFLRDNLCRIVIDNLRFYQDRGDFTIISYVLMPSHLHLIIKTAPQISVSKCMANLKRMSSRQISDTLKSEQDSGLIALLEEHAKKEPAPDCRVWKPRFDCLVITNENTVKQKLCYIDENPVRAGLARRPSDWLYSSAGKYELKANCMLDVDCDWTCLGYAKMPSGKGP